MVVYTFGTRSWCSWSFNRKKNANTQSIRELHWHSYFILYMYIHLLIKSLIYRCYCEITTQFCTFHFESTEKKRKKNRICNGVAQIKRLKSNVNNKSKMHNSKTAQFSIYKYEKSKGSVFWIIDFWIRLTSIKTILMHFSFCMHAGRLKTLCLPRWMELLVVFRLRGNFFCI